MKTSLLQGKGYSMPMKQENKKYISQKKKRHMFSKVIIKLLPQMNIAFSYTFTTLTGQLLSIEPTGQNFKNN